MPQVLRSALQLAICCPVPECEKLNRQLLTGTGRELLSLVHFLRLAEWAQCSDTGCACCWPSFCLMHHHLQCVSCHAVATTVGIQVL
jgi:hypothetical protein